MRQMRRILYVAHNHSAIRPGGMEAYADELYRTIGALDGYEATFLSRVGRPQSTLTAHDGTRFAVAAEDPNLYYLHTQPQEFDPLLRTALDKQLYTHDWREFLRATQPDIVHFHHSLFLGYDMLRETRHTLPQAAIVYTLHEFVPICHQAGTLVRAGTLELCTGASPQRCHQCFPNISPQSFFLRERFIKSAFEDVDMFVAPSGHARQCYIDWGIEPERIVHERYGRIPVTPLEDPPDAGRRRRIGFFGQITPHKGVDVLLEAMRILKDARIELLLHAASLDMQPPGFRERVDELLARTAGSVRNMGSYEHSQLPELMSAIDWMIVPSIWWETGPLVIHEAMMHRRPVICSGIGGMAEQIDDGINGLHVRVRDPASLADTIRRAVDDPTLWDKLRANITDPHPMDRHVDLITGIYDELLERRRRSEAA
jgi:glycosyltransferase involved in cell wall biosynthesis